ncbi:hypothetical protein [Teredinibacter waterburyi]|nr:hypothetical protein [Teredinibacter waterburyi]
MNLATAGATGLALYIPYTVRDYSTPTPRLSAHGKPPLTPPATPEESTKI